MTKKILDYVGAKTFFGVESNTKQKIIETYWSYINWTADNESHLFLIKDNNPFFGYFKVTTELLLFWLEKKNLFQLLQNADKIGKRKLGDTDILPAHEIKAKELAIKELENMKVEPFIGNLLTTSHNYYSIGEIEKL